MSLVVGLLQARHRTVEQLPRVPDPLLTVVMVFNLVKTSLLLRLALVLVALAKTLLWKTMEVILTNVFCPGGNG